MLMEDQVRRRRDVVETFARRPACRVRWATGDEKRRDLPGRSGFYVRNGEVHGWQLPARGFAVAVVGRSRFGSTPPMLLFLTGH